LATPRQSLSGWDAIAMVVGIVIGAGIFRLPPLVAGNVAGPGEFIAVWVAGGLISMVGALCYAELASTYPNTGGDYHFLTRAFGAGPAFLYAWARMTVIQTGSIALPAFVVGDYVAAASAVANSTAEASPWVSPATAAVVVVGLTALNMMGVREGKTMQKCFTALVVFGMLLIVAAGATLTTRGANAAEVAAQPVGGSLGMALVFVLFTYSGWNEAAYLSAEMKGGRRSIVWALVLGLATVMAIYILVNLAFVAALGFAGAAASQAIAADVLNAAWGTSGAMVITAVLVVAALSTANATVFTGARTNYALGRDFSLFGFLGQWSERTSTPRNALIVQGLIALALVALGARTRRGVETMVDYTAPVFWLFFLLVGASLLVLRYREPEAERPFRVPLYPVLPLVFCATSGYMLYASLAYAGRGALVGVAVLAVGLPIMLVAYLAQNKHNGGARIAIRSGPTENLDD
jgi:basic amino acid/polyamine antiporter, APA family